MRTIAIFALVVIASFAVSVWVTRAQNEYLKIRGARLGDPGPLGTLDLFGRYARSPLLWLRDVVPLWRAQTAVLTTVQSDPAVEAARRRYNVRQNVSLLVYLAGLTAILVSAAAGQ